MEEGLAGTRAAQPSVPFASDGLRFHLSSDAGRGEVSLTQYHLCR